MSPATHVASTELRFPDSSAVSNPWACLLQLRPPAPSVCSYCAFECAGCVFSNFFGDKVVSQGDQDSSANFVGCSFQQNTVTKNSAEDYDHSIIHAKTWERSEGSQHTTQVLVRACCFQLLLCMVPALQRAAEPVLSGCITKKSSGSTFAHSGTLHLRGGSAQ